MVILLLLEEEEEEAEVAVFVHSLHQAEVQIWQQESLGRTESSYSFCLNLNTQCIINNNVERGCKVWKSS